MLSFSALTGEVLTQTPAAFWRLCQPALPTEARHSVTKHVAKSVSPDKKDNSKDKRVVSPYPQVLHDVVERVGELRQLLARLARHDNSCSLHTHRISWFCKGFSPSFFLDAFLWQIWTRRWACQLQSCWYFHRADCGLRFGWWPVFLTSKVAPTYSRSSWVSVDCSRRWATVSCVQICWDPETGSRESCPRTNRTAGTFLVGNRHPSIAAGHAMCGGHLWPTRRHVGFEGVRTSLSTQSTLVLPEHDLWVLVRSVAPLVDRAGRRVEWTRTNRSC